MKRKSDESRTPSQIKLSTRQKTQEDSESLYDLQLCDQDLGDIQLNMSIRSKDLRKNLNFDDSEFGADLSEVERPTFRQTPQVLDPLLQDLDASIKESQADFEHLGMELQMDLEHQTREHRIQ